MNRLRNKGGSVPVAPDSTLDVDVDVDDNPAGAADESAEGDCSNPPLRQTGRSERRRPILVALAMVVSLAALVGWLGFGAYRAHQQQAQRNLFVQAARQGAINLATIDFQRADADVQRILDGATGPFHDEFSTRSQPFVEIVKQAQSVTVGTVQEAGLESVTGDSAQVLVAVNVMTTNAGTPEPDPRAWRMRIVVQKVGDDAKVSNVEFVP